MVADRPLTLGMYIYIWVFHVVYDCNVFYINRSPTFMEM